MHTLSCTTHSILSLCAESYKRLTNFFSSEQTAHTQRLSALFLLIKLNRDDFSCQCGHLKEEFYLDKKTKQKKRREDLVLSKGTYVN